MRYKELSPPSYLFAHNRGHSSHVRGLTQAGPFDQGECPSSPRLLFVFPEEHKNDANQLFVSLKNGIGPFPGTDSMFSLRLTTENMVRTQPFSIDGLSTASAAERYKTVLQDYITNNDLSDLDAAVIIHPKTSVHECDNPYLNTKFLCLLNDLPAQVVTTDLFSDARTFQWSVANVALALFAKMGGYPWAVRSELGQDTLVVGLNRALVQSPSNNNRRRFFGFATAFSHHGLYMGLRIFPPVASREDFAGQLETSVRDAIQAWHTVIGRPINLVLHMQKDLHKSEKDALSSAISSAGADFVRSSSVVRLNRADHVRVMDKRNEELIPRSGSLVELDSRRGVMQITGREEQSLGRTIFSSPWNIRIVTQAGDAPRLDALCENILSLSNMNWRGLNAQAVPVSVTYPERIAMLMGRFSEAGFDVDKIRDKPVMKRPWFI